MASSLSYHQTCPIAEENNSTDEYKSPPIRTWKKFPPTTVDRIAYFPDSASTPYNPQNRIESLGISPLRRIRRNPCPLSPIDRLKLGVKRRGREICKSFELNQTCPTSSTAAEPPPPPPLIHPRPNDDQDGVVGQQQCSEVTLSSIYSSSPSYLSCAASSAGTSQRESRRHRPVMEKIRVDGANGLRFSARRTKGCFVSAGTGSPYNSVAQSSGHTQPLSTNTNTTTTTTSGDSMARFSKAEMNPNKAVFTIHSKTSRILIVNKNACEMLGYSSKELCEIEFSDLLVNKNKSHVSALAEGQLNSEDGTLVLLSGKVVEMSTKSGGNLAVSLWIRQIDSDGRCLAVAEPVERRIARLMIDGVGAVASGDYEALLLFQMDSVEEFTGLHVTTLIPAINLPEAAASASDTTPTTGLPKSVHKQKATGRTKDGLSFPLCLTIDRWAAGGGTAMAGDALDQAGSEAVAVAVVPSFCVTVFVFNNLSGLMVIDEAGQIESCNHHFSMLMFGYAQGKIIGRHVSKVIPNFGQEFAADLSRSRNATISSLENEEESETETDHVERTDLTVSSCAENAKLCLDFSTSKVNSSMVSELSDDLSNIKSLSSDTRSVPPQEDAAAGVAKSMSDNLLCHENNHENNRNVGNVSRAKRLPPSLGTKSAAVVENALDSVCDNTFEEDYSQLMDNEILTPVNETDFFVGPGSSAAETAGQPQKRHSTSSRSFNAAEAGAHELPLQGPCPSESDLRESSSGGSHSQHQHQQQAKRLSMSIQDGKYKGEAVHSDGNVIDIIYTVSGQTLPSGRVHCVWVSRDPDTELNGAEKSAEDELGDGELCEGEDIDGQGDEEEDEERNQNLTLTFDSVNSTVENSLGQAIKATAQNTATTTTNTSTNAQPARVVPSNGSRPNSMSLLSQCEDELVAGEFSKHYSTLKQIGKGAYGYVKMAYRSTDRLLVIAKFILKEKLCPQFMVVTEDKREIPMEIYLLTTVQHPNIVSVLEVFENDKFYQLVMEKHGCGMDLFEFIDRLPMMDEKLACHIFRQIANAVNYLHSLHILHRDLKDENIIIDQNFHVKLIDFGSATFLEPGKLFSTFYGTTEYCSPEVLAGNKYAGPELEMWSLGVTLYVIMFFENPFVDIEETLHAALVIPQKVSGQLEALLLSMLDKNPLTRCTMCQLIADPWLAQEINAAQFNFAWVVPCEAFESNPEKYYHGQAVSSGTAISTTSPQNSLSLVDGDSMLDVEEDGDDCDEAAQLELDEEPTGLGDSCLAVDLEGEAGDGARGAVLKLMEPKTVLGTRNQHPVCGLKPFTNAVPKDQCIREGGHESNTNVVAGGERHKVANSSGSRRQEGKRRSKKNVKNKKASAASRKGAQKRTGQLNVDASMGTGGLALSKSENNIFEKSSKLSMDCGTGAGNRLFSAYEGLVTSMRDLQLESGCEQSPNQTMNDFSRTQVLNMIAVSREVVGPSECGPCENGDDACPVDLKGSCLDEESPIKLEASCNSGWADLTPKSSNRSNFQILSISYTGGSQEDLGEDNAYENDSWDDDEEEDVDDIDEHEAI